MSKQIDWDQPLSDEDREWAKQFPLMHPLIETNDARFAAAPADDSLGGGGEAEPEAPYEEWTVAELVAEINSRNESDGKSISSKGVKAELIARLQADDAEEAAKAANA